MAAKILGMSPADFVRSNGPEAAPLADYVTSDDMLAAARKALRYGPGASARFIAGESR